MISETAEYQQTANSDDLLIGEPETASARRVIGRPFEPGVSGNPAGRPRKGQTLPERLRADIDRRAPKIIDGLLTKAEKGDTRAFVAAMSYSYGVPATKLIIEQADNPAADLLMRMMAARGLVPPGVTDASTSPQIESPHEVIDADDIRPG